MTSQTMAQALKEAVEHAGGKASKADIVAYIDKHFPNRWRSTTLTAHLYACAVNNPKSYLHHPHADRFLYKNADGTFEFYDSHTHGENIWAPSEGEETETPDEIIEASISLERDIEDHLVAHLQELEKGLTLIERQAANEIGRIDILARDAKGRTVAIELKVGPATDAAVGQIARYLGWLSKQGTGEVRGILVAADFPDGVKYGASAVPNLTLHQYRVSLSFEVAGL